MATETVPADIAAAIETFESLCRVEGHEFSQTRELDAQTARAELEAAILTHLRKADELKSVLDRIASGGV